MGCSAGLAGLRLVQATCHRPREALLVACELSSLHFQYTDELDQLTANVLFADGAAALEISTRPGPVRVQGCACAALPEKADQMIWAAGDHGLALRLSRELPETLGAALPAAVSDFLAGCDAARGGIRHWLVHPGGPQILDSVQQSLGLPDDSLAVSRDVLRRNGNMSSPTIFFILKEFMDAAATGPAVAMAFGPGLTIELALLELGASAQES